MTSVVSVIQTLMLIFVPETPKYLILTKQDLLAGKEVPRETLPFPELLILNKDADAKVRNVSNFRKTL
jgi:hypothetical protein